MQRRTHSVGSTQGRGPSVRGGQEPDIDRRAGSGARSGLSGWPPGVDSRRIKRSARAIIPQRQATTDLDGA